MRRIDRIVGLLLLAAALIGPRPAAADEAGDIRAVIEQSFRTSFGEGENALVTHGAIEVTPAGDGYDVTIADIRSPALAKGGPALGSITAHLRVKDADLYEITSLELPERVTLAAPDGKPASTLLLPDQQFTGLWSKAVKGWLAADLSYRDIELLDDKGETVATVGEVSGKLDSTEKAQGRWDQRSHFGMAGLAITLPEAAVTVGRIEAESALNDIDFAKYNRLAEAAVSMSLESAELTPELMQALGDLTGLWSGGAYKLSLHDIAAKDGAGEPLLALPEAVIEASAGDLDQPLSRLSFAVRQHGLAVAAAPPAQRDLVPNDLAIQVSLENLPFAQLWAKALDSLAEAEKMPPDQRQMAGMMFLGTLQQSLAAAKTELRLSDWHAAAPAAGADLDGVITASAEAAMGAVASIKLDIAGLDKAIDGIRAAAPEDQTLAMQLEALRGFSQRETAADGRVIDHYRLELTPQGQLLINGKPFGGPGAGKL